MRNNHDFAVLIWLKRQIILPQILFLKLNWTCKRQKYVACSPMHTLIILMYLLNRLSILCHWSWFAWKMCTWTFRWKQRGAKTVTYMKKLPRKIYITKTKIQKVQKYDHEYFIRLQRVGLRSLKGHQFFAVCFHIRVKNHSYFYK